MNKYHENFYWGSAFSGPQTENKFSNDGSGYSIWDYWFKNKPEKFYKQTFVKNDFYKNFKGDIKIAKDLNFNSLRTSIQWSRLIPDGKNVNLKAVDFYNKLIDEMLKHNIEPFINLHHFDLPWFAQEKGGWENREVIDNFAFFAKTCFKLFGKKVKKWFTFNEPVVTQEAGYLYGLHFPLVQDLQRSLNVMWNQILAHKKAVKEFRNQKIQGDIGIILNITPIISRSDSKEDMLAQKWAEIFNYSCYLDPIVKGSFPQALIDEAKVKKYLWDIKDEDWDLIKDNPISFLGINYYNPRRVKAGNKKINKQLLPNPYYYTTYKKKDAVYNKSRGWEIYPKALYLAMKNIQNNYDNIKFYIAENGIGIHNEEQFKDESGVIQDNYRINFIKDHLFWVRKAIDEGANCIGYHMWTYIDNWSWTNAYKNRYGFYELDLKTKKRHKKLSADLWISIIK